MFVTLIWPMLPPLNHWVCILLQTVPADQRVYPFILVCKGLTA